MAKLYGEILSSALMTFDKSFARANGQPLDSTEVYYSLVAAKEYAATDVAYIGQKIVVIEGGKITHYSIEDAAGNLKELGAKPVGDEKSIVVAADGTVSLKGVGTLVFERDILGEDDQPTGEKEAVQYQPLMTKNGLVWVEPSKTTVEGLATLIDALTKRVDTAEDEIDALQEAVGVAAEGETAATGLYKEIADEKARALAAEKALGERIDGIDYVDNDELTAALGSYVTTESFNTFKGENTQAIANAKSGAEQTAANALSAARTEISKEIDDDVKVAKDRADEAYTLADGKVDKGDYATDKKALQDEDAAIREIAEAAKSSIDTFLNSQEIDNTVNTLKELQTEIEKMTDATELATALSSKADKSVVEGIEGRVKAIEDAPYVTKDQLDGVDGKFDNYTNTTDMNAALDLKANKSVVDAMYTNGKIDELVQGAKDYADDQIEALELGTMSKEVATDYVKKADALGYGDILTKTDAQGIYATKEYLGTIPNDEQGNPKSANVIAYIEKRAGEVLSQATGGSSESAASVKGQLDTFKAEINPKVAKNIEDIATINNKLKDVEANADVNIIETVKVNGKALTPDENKAVDITVPTKFSDITDDSGFDARITEAQNQANKGVNDASAAQTTANEAKASAAGNATSISELNTTVAGHTTTIGEHTTKITNLETFQTEHTALYNSLKGTVDGHVTAIAGKAAQTALDSAVARIAVNEGAIKTLNETTIPGINNNLANNYYKKTEIYKKSEVDDLIKDFATDAEVEAAIKVESDRAKLAEKANADALSVLIGSHEGDNARSVRAIAADEINTLVGGANSEDTITNITTLIEYVNANGGEVTGMQTDIGNLQAIVNGLGGEGQPATVMALVEQEIAAIPLATLVEGEDGVVTVTKGLILPEDNKFEMAAGKVTAISTDLLVQGANTLILNGGSASN